MSQPIAETASQLNFTDQKIRDFGDLQRGWHFGEGVAPERETIETALVLNRALLRNHFSVTNAFPGVSGEIQVTGRHGSLSVELTIEPGSGITLVLEYEKEEIIYVEGLTLVDTLAQVSNMRGGLWALSGLYIRNIMTPIHIHSQVLPSSPPATTRGFPLLMKTAYTQQAQAVAVISKGTIGTFQVARRSSGLSALKTYQPSASSFVAMVGPKTIVTATSKA